MNFILGKLKEGSTWSSIAALVAGINFIPHADQISQSLLAVGVFVPALLGIWFK